jgi:hypothetical protein
LKKQKTLTTVGEAARFMRGNFSRQRFDNADREYAAKALEAAAETNDAEGRKNATEAVISAVSR